METWHEISKGNWPSELSHIKENTLNSFQCCFFTWKENNKKLPAPINHILKEKNSTSSINESEDLQLSDRYRHISFFLEL